MLEQIMTVGFVTAFLTASVRMAVPPDLRRTGGNHI